jgi:hypothetical protein
VGAGVRARRRDRQLLTAAIAASIAASLLAGADHAYAAPRVDASCWWDGSTLRAEGLPTNRLFGITADGAPHGVWLSTDDGSFSRGELAPAEMIFYTRGGGGAIFKFGSQLQDYHPICVAVP